jgi:hypothetical protein
MVLGVSPFKKAEMTDPHYKAFVEDINTFWECFELSNTLSENFKLLM